jgi:hypothetical protein
MRWANGAVYDGEWWYDERHGRGTYGNEHGDFFVVRWLKGKMHGGGTFTPANEEPYECLWSKGTLKRKFAKKEI